MRRKGKYIITENNEFQTQNMNPDSSVAAVNVNDPTLSLNFADTQVNLVRQAQAKLSGILTSLKFDQKLSSPRNLPDQEITELKVTRIYTSSNIHFNIYISFTINEIEYSGKVVNFGSIDPQVTSEAFRDIQNLVVSKEWLIRTKGMILKALRMWLTPDAGNWISLKEVRVVNIRSGEEKFIPKNSVVNVVRSYELKNIISYCGETYQISGLGYFYFNYWFIKETS